MKKKFSVVLLVLVMCFVITGCSEEKEKNKENEQGVNTQQEQQENQPQNKGISDNLGWPDNDFTKQVPKPEQAFIEEAMADNSACYTYPNWTVAQAREYVEKLKNNGFHVSSTMIDSTDDYLIYLKNEDESYQVSVAADGINPTLIISIPFNKR